MALAAAPQGMMNVDELIKSLGNDTLFVIERNIDVDVVVYQAKLNADKTELAGVQMFWTKQHNWAEREEVTESAKTVFYGVEMQRIKRGLYRIQLNCFSDSQHFIDLHIKKSGAVIPKVLIQGKECTLKKIYADVVMFPPNVNGIWVHGMFKDEPISEKIEVSRSFIDRIDLSDFMPKLGI